MIQDIVPHTFDNAYQVTAPDGDSRVMYFDGKKILVKRKGEGWTYPRFRALEPFNEGIYENARYLFMVDGERYYLVDNLSYPMDDTYVMENTQIFRKARPSYLEFIGITGYQLYQWYQSRRFCGRCGKPMVHSEKERMVHCESCGQIEYPKICPAVIVAVIDGDRILTSTYANQSRTSYALLAGFAEIGEMIEDTVKREVMEEVGLKVKNLRFYKSQPWSFTDTLLIGFFVDLDGDATITLDREELGSAQWFTREELPVEADNLSLTREMMMYFKSGKI